MDRVMRPGGENYSATFGEKYPAVDTGNLNDQTHFKKTYRQSIGVSFKLGGNRMAVV
jgi:hypothetical protein